MSREQLLNDIRTVAAITFEARQFKTELLKMSDEERLEYVKQNLLTTDLHDGHGDGVYITFQYMEKVDDKHSSIVVGFQWEDCGRGGEVIPSPRRSLTDDGDEFVEPIMRLTFKSEDVDQDLVLSDGFGSDDGFESDDDLESDDDFRSDEGSDDVYNSSQELLNKLVKVEVVSYNPSKSDNDPLFIITPNENQILVDFGIPVSKDSDTFFQDNYELELDDELLMEIKEIVSEITRYEC